jgi:formylglycine-generating enzyme required for sulfatase activity
MADPGEECDLAEDNGVFAGGCTAECRLPWREVPGGTVQLGSPPDERGRHDDEPWVRAVEVRPFEILATEVTVAQHRRFGHILDGDSWPQAGLTWRQATQYCEDVGARLPTEAEWEAANRASSRSAWSCGDDPECLSARAWYAQAAAHPVAARDPNGLGLYDLDGNVWEWVADCYHPSGYRVAEITRAEQVHVRGACNWRVVRGGSYQSPPELLRSAFRARRRPDDPQPTVGFRCVRGPPTAPHPSGRA